MVNNIDRKQNMMRNIYLPTHWDILDGMWQAVGRWTARVAFKVKPSLGSLRSLMRMQMHFLVLSRTTLRDVQQSMVGVLASPPTYGRQLARVTSLSAHSSLSFDKSELARMPSIMSSNAVTLLLETIGKRERDKEYWLFWVLGKESLTTSSFMLCFVNEFKMS